MEETDMLNDQLPEILDLLKSNKRKTGQKEEVLSVSPTGLGYYVRD
jgi:hypothetical protein